MWRLCCIKRRKRALWNDWIRGGEIGLAWERSNVKQYRKDDMEDNAFHQTCERMINLVSVPPLEQGHSAPVLLQPLPTAAQRNTKGKKQFWKPPPNSMTPSHAVLTSFSKFLKHATLIYGYSKFGATKNLLRCISCSRYVHAQVKYPFSVNFWHFFYLL